MSRRVDWQKARQRQSPDGVARTSTTSTPSSRLYVRTKLARLKAEAARRRRTES